MNIESGESAFYILGVVLIYYLYYYSANSDLLKRFTTRINRGTDKNLLLFFAKKLMGFILLGVIPGIIYYFIKYPAPVNFGLSLNHLATHIPIILILIILIVSTAYLHQKLNPDFTSLEIKDNLYNFQFVALNIFGWVIYLVAYEFLFRGILLFECYYAFGLWPAICINVAFYSAIHMPDGKDQVIGALIFGTVAGYLAITLGTILVPIIMHITLSISTIIFSLRLVKNAEFKNSKY